jgi:hypothetical protein
MIFINILKFVINLFIIYLFSIVIYYLFIYYLFNFYCFSQKRNHGCGLHGSYDTGPHVTTRRCRRFF